jgi:phage terminase small subunit
MSGPPPQPNVIKLLRGNPGRRKIRREPQPTIPESMPSPPPFLAPYAQDEWWTTGPELHRLRLLRGRSHDLRRLLRKLRHLADGD